MNRREFLRLSGLIATAAALAGCQPVYQTIGGPVEERLPGAGPILRPFDEAVLKRLTFGPRQSERATVNNIGLANWIEEQLSPEGIDDSPLDWRLRGFDFLDMTPDDLYTRGERLFDGFDAAPILSDLSAATLLRQVYSRRQIYELMVEFWTDHFNISMDKENVWYLKPIDDRDVIRKHALGNFRDLVQASAHSPAMLTYLDNQANLAGAPNENYARELMELHTLGVDGGYTQNDVMELARCFTGWTVKESFWRGDFEFNQDFHDTGAKTVLGMRISPNGQTEAESVIDRLAIHPATAHYISHKLARRFISDNPPEEIVNHAAGTFFKTNGDITSTLRTILFDGLLAEGSLIQPKFRRPVHFITAALRALNVETDGYGGEALDFSRTLSSLGQPPFQWPTPDGPPDTAPEWMGNLLPRWKFALRLAREEIDGTSFEPQSILDPNTERSLSSTIETLWTALIGSPPNTDNVQNLANTLAAAGAREYPGTGRIIAAGMIASPAFQWR